MGLLPVKVARFFRVAKVTPPANWLLVAREVEVVLAAVAVIVAEAPWVDEGLAVPFPEVVPVMAEELTTPSKLPRMKL